MSSSFTCAYLNHTSPERVNHPDLLVATSPTHPFSFLSNSLQTGANIHINVMRRIRDRLVSPPSFSRRYYCCTQGRPPSCSDMVSRPHYLKSRSFILVCTSLCLVLILSPRHTHFSHWLCGNHSLQSANKDRARSLCKPRGVENPSSWLNASGSIFICFPPWLFLPHSSEAFFFFEFKNAKNKYTAFNTSIMDSFWNIIASVGIIA